MQNQATVELIWAIRDGIFKQQDYETLQNEGIDLSVKDPICKRNALHDAVQSNNPELVAAILAHKTCPAEVLEQLDRDGSSPLHLAIMSYRDSSAECRVKSVEIVKQILNSDKCTSSTLKKKADHSADYTNTPMYTALHLAVDDRSQELVEAILASEKCTTEVLRMNAAYVDTPLHLAIKHENRSAVQAILKSAACTTEFLSAQSSKGDNPLSFAVKQGNADIVKDILESNKCSANILNLKNSYSRTPRQLAAEQRNSQVLEVLDAAKKRFYHQEKFFTLPDQPSDQAKINAVIEFLKDYSGSGKNLLRLHWNRHHTKRAKELITTLQKLENGDTLAARQAVDECLKTAQGLQGFNEKGSFNRRMKLCLNKLGSC